MLKWHDDTWQVVFKEMNITLLQSRKLERARRELHLLQTLHHEHIIQYHAAFQEGQHLCIVQEYAAGGTLELVISRAAEEQANGGNGRLETTPWDPTLTPRPYDDVV